MQSEETNKQIENITENHILVECGWEVCWQLGGIYTVLRSKAPSMTARWGDHYALVGPYNADAAAVEFEPSTEDSNVFSIAVQKLKERGITAHYGRWLITGRPQVVLIDFLASFQKIADYKYFLWKDHQIESPDDKEVNDVILFGYLVVEFFECLLEAIKDANAANPSAPKALEHVERPVGLPVIAHFHEWMAGVPIPVIKKRQLPIATVFTTHATLLGRYLAAEDSNFYNNLPFVNPHAAASGMNIYCRFSIERAATHGADCFTTISEITSHETEHLLGRKPDVLLPNGLNLQRFTALHELQNLHGRYKEQIHEFVTAHFFPSYTFDLDKTLYLFTAGRYEYRNKGLDLFIEGLARLNWRLKQEKSPITVVAFIITKAAVKGYNVEVLKSQRMFDDLKRACENISESIQPKLLQSAVKGEVPCIDDILDETSQVRLKRLHHAWKRGGWPSICTHDMLFDASDPILEQLRISQLHNGPHDPVKVIYHPEFLSATSPVIGLDYEQFVRGTHLGVFPSYYEPWGYTPLECMALGIPSITSDLSGFGSYLKRNVPDHSEKGAYVSERYSKNFWEAADQLTNLMFKVITLSRRERIDLRNRVESVSENFGWNVLEPNYYEAEYFAWKKFTEK